MQAEAKNIIDNIIELMSDGTVKKTAAEIFNDWKKRNENVKDFSGMKIENLDLRSVNFQGLNFGDNASFLNCNLTQAKFQHSTINRGTFQNCNLQSASFENATITNSKIERTIDCEREGHSAYESHFTKSIAEGTTFSIELRGATFVSANLCNATFAGSDLREANFNKSNLAEADFRNVTVNTLTKFENLESVEQCTIERYTLYYLDNSFGGLTTGNRMEMDIIDDVARLRAQFSGVWMWGHLWSLAVFLVPYLWFIGQKWTVAKFQSPEDREQSMAFWEAILRFILRGGEEWQSGWSPNWLPFLTFLTYLIYNGFRLSLLLKTKLLETEEITKGLPALFSLSEHTAWEKVFRLTRYGFWIALILVMINTFHFLTMRIPL